MQSRDCNKATCPGKLSLLYLLLICFSIDELWNARNFSIIIHLISDACNKLYRGLQNEPNTFCCKTKFGKGHSKGKGCGGKWCTKNGEECCSSSFKQTASCKQKNVLLVDFLELVIGSSVRHQANLWAI